MTKKLPLVQCRICKEKIDRNKDTDWIMPSKNFYYHEKCYNDWKNGTNKKDEEYISFIYDFISRDMKFKYDYHMCEAQRKKFLKEKKMTNQGIFFALKYFYEVKNGDWEKSHGGIGIVPYIYTESCAYWVKEKKKNNSLVEQIEKQMRQAKVQKDVVIKRTTKKKKENKFDLSSIAEMEDE